MEKCGNCARETANHYVNLVWGIIPLCQDCAELHAAWRAEDLEEQGPRPTGVEFFVTHEFHGMNRTYKYGCLEHALADYRVRAEYASKCKQRDHHSQIIAVKDNQRIVIKSERY